MNNLTLITGASRGFGAHLAVDLAKKNHSLILHYFNSFDEIKKIQKECLKYTSQVEIFSANFLEIDEIYSFYDQIKNYPIKFLINNVGNYLIESALNTEIDLWINLFQTNLHAPFILIKLLSKTLILNKGSIINLGVAGLNSFRADTYSSAYTISKGAFFALTKDLAKELKPYNVTVNMVSPGFLENSIDLDKAPLTAIIKFEEVSKIIKYLLDEESRNITGQNIEVSGGVRL